MSADEGFLSRWSRRKAQVQRSEPAAGPAAEAAPAAAGAVAPVLRQAPVVAEPASDAGVPAAPAAPLPTMDDVAQLTRASDYSRFVVRGVDEGVKRAALKKLFADPHFNVMDGLDVYIEDYGATTPITPSELRQMAQAKVLGLFDDEEEDEEARPVERTPDGAPQPLLSQSGPTAPDEPPVPIADEDADLRLQPDDAAGRPGPEPGVGRERG
jgi:hypothetical protein